MALAHYNLKQLFQTYSILVKVPLESLQDHPDQRQLVPTAVKRLTAAFLETGIDRINNPGLGLLTSDSWLIERSDAGLELHSTGPCVFVLSGKHRLAALKEWIRQHPNQAASQSFWYFKVLPPGTTSIV